MRKLATIQIISNLKPIEGADKIEVALMENLGWECVVKKGEFRVGDKIIYCEVDSVLPDKPEFEFMRGRKFRVKTIKLRGQVSQGLLLPIHLLSEKASIDRSQPGDDVTEMLEITKYLSQSEREEFNEIARRKAIEKSRFKKFMMRYSWVRRLFLTRKKRSGFPYWVSKTDEERIQNIPHVISQFADHEVYITEKVDYQSVTFTGKMLPRFNGLLGKLIPLKRYQFVVCSRNMTTNDKSTLYWKIAEKYGLEKILKENPTLTIQGEQGDTKVQGNKYGIKGPELWIFNIIDHEKNYYFDWEEIKAFCWKYNLTCVPELRFNIPLKSIGSTVPELVEYSKGRSLLADIQREGIVVRCIKDGKKLLSFKVINPDFLLKYE